MNSIITNRIVTSDIHPNRIFDNGVGLYDEHPEVDENWFTLDVSALDGGDMLK